MSNKASISYQLSHLEHRLRQVNDMAEVCRAYRKLFSDSKFQKLVGMGMECESSFYSSWDSFDCRFPKLQDQKVLRQAIRGLMLNGYDVDQDHALFKRRDIYDKMAYASFPLNRFVETTANCKLIFSLPLPMMFAVSSFKFHRCRKRRHDGWWGRLYLHDARCEKGYEGDREVAETFSPEEATREQMFEELINDVRSRGDSALFTITGDTLIGAMIKAESDTEREVHDKKELTLT